MIMLDSVNKVNKKYHLQTLLEECKYAKQKKNKIENLINDDSKLNSSDESGNESDNDFNIEADNGSDSDEFEKPSKKSESD